jgi:two-component system, OmpR family, alkaline phosphatase synthesis response regulator PhoP
MARILIIEDERLVRESMAVFLGLHYDVLTSSDGRDGLESALRLRPDLVILDIGLPGIDGLEVCRQLRQRGFGAPILFLTSHDEEVDKLTGFSVGGDDYIVKPVSLPLLQARIHAALRRAAATPVVLEEVHDWGPVRVNFTTHELLVAGEEVVLSAKEMDLLRYMVSHRGVLLTREALLADVWHYEADVSSRTVDTHILNLRRKLRDGNDGRSYIHTIRGKGYKFSG